jgi:hypothetical protein
MLNADSAISTALANQRSSVTIALVEPTLPDAVGSIHSATPSRKRLRASTRPRRLRRSPRARSEPRRRTGSSGSGYPWREHWLTLRRQMTEMGRREPEGPWQSSDPHVERRPGVFAQNRFLLPTMPATRRAREGPRPRDRRRPRLDHIGRTQLIGQRRSQLHRARARERPGIPDHDPPLSVRLLRSPTIGKFLEEREAVPALGLT